MNRMISQTKISLATVALVIAIIFSPQAAFAKDGIGVIPPNAQIQGKSYGDWGAAWWQWAFSLPVDQSPLFDENGSCVHGANGQSGKVWYLAGVFNVSGRAERNCTIPTGKMLFFPIINIECDTLTPPTLDGDEATLRACARQYGIFSNLVAEVDGVAIENLEGYIAETPRFAINLPENNILGLPAGSGSGVSKGASLMLAPLSKGKHTVHFSGTIPEFAFTLDITYYLTVE